MVLLTVGLAFRSFDPKWGIGTAFATYDIMSGKRLSSIRFYKWFSGWQEYGWFIHPNGVIQIQVRKSQHSRAQIEALYFSLSAAYVRAFPNWQRQLTNIEKQKPANEDLLWNWHSELPPEQLEERSAVACGQQDLEASDGDAGWTPL